MRQTTEIDDALLNCGVCKQPCSHAGSPGIWKQRWWRAVTGVGEASRFSSHGETVLSDFGRAQGHSFWGCTICWVWGVGRCVPLNYRLKPRLMCAV